MIAQVQFMKNNTHIPFGKSSVHALFICRVRKSMTVCNVVLGCGLVIAICALTSCQRIEPKKSSEQSASPTNQTDLSESHEAVSSEPWVAIGSVRRKDADKVIEIFVEGGLMTPLVYEPRYNQYAVLFPYSQAKAAQDLVISSGKCSSFQPLSDKLMKENRDWRLKQREERKKVQSASPSTVGQNVPPEAK